MNKDLIIKDAAHFLQLLHPVASKSSRGCLYHAAAMNLSLKSHGYRSFIQAGSSSFLAWPDAPEPEPTHYSYVFEGISPEAAVNLVTTGHLPELHAWVVFQVEKDGQYYLVDSTTQYLPSLVQDMGKVWGTDLPPDCLWTSVDDLPAGWFYEAQLQATMLVSTLITELVKDKAKELAQVAQDCI